MKVGVLTLASVSGSFLLIDVASAAALDLFLVTRRHSYFHRQSSKSSSFKASPQIFERKCFFSSAVTTVGGGFFKATE